MSRRSLLIGLVVLFLFGGVGWLWWLAQGPGGTDEQQIRAQIQRGRQAAEEMNVGALMAVVSPDYRDDLGLTRPVLAYQTRQRLREAQRVEVTIPSNQLRVQLDPVGRTATSTGPVELRITDRQGGAQPLSLSPTLHWRKEHVRRFLLFSAEEWRVVRAEGFEAAGE